jgi:choline dehydrogenase
MKSGMYDIIVVGAGSAGCVLANRLSADGTTRVLLLEAGGRDWRPEIAMPAAFGKLFNSSVDWGYLTEAQPGLAHRKIAWPRGKMLGGSSSMNAQIYMRGHRMDYDGWVISSIIRLSRSSRNPSSPFRCWPPKRRRASFAI